MAIRVDIPKDFLIRSLEASIASTKRANVKQPNKMIVELNEKDIAIYQTALNTLQETK